MKRLLLYSPETPAMALDYYSKSVMVYASVKVCAQSPFIDTECF